MNSFFGLGPMELFLIIFIALIVLGPQRLPGTIREVMKYWRYFRNLSGELTSQLGEEFKDLEDLNPQRILEDLANELDDEVEQTQEAAGVKKKSSAKKSSVKSTTASKTSAAKSTKSVPPKTSSAKVEPGVEPIKRGDASAAATASAAASAAYKSKSAKTEDAAQPETEIDQAPADEGSEPKAEEIDSSTQTSDNGAKSSKMGHAGKLGVRANSVGAGEKDNSILPPEKRVAATESVQSEAEATSASVDGTTIGKKQTTSKSTGSTPVNGNGKGASPEDEG